MECCTYPGGCTFSLTRHLCFCHLFVDHMGLLRPRLGFRYDVYCFEPMKCLAHTQPANLIYGSYNQVCFFFCRFLDFALSSIINSVCTSFVVNVRSTHWFLRKKDIHCVHWKINEPSALSSSENECVESIEMFFFLLIFLWHISWFDLRGTLISYHKTIVS